MQQLGKGVSHRFLLHIRKWNITPQLIRCDYTWKGRFERSGVITENLQQKWPVIHFWFLRVLHFFGANLKQQGALPVTSSAIHCTKALTHHFWHIKGKGLAKQLCPNTSLLAENWHPHVTLYRLRCVLYSLYWLRSCLFAAMNTYITFVCHSSSLAGDLPSSGEVTRIWWLEEQTSLRKSIETL